MHATTAGKLRPVRSLRAFTLVELLVVIAIIAILIALAFPVIGNMRAKGNIARSLSNLKSLYTANTSYFNDKGQFPSANDQPISATASRDFPAKYWEERLIVYLGLANEISANSLKKLFVAGQQPPSVFTVPGRRPLAVNGGDTTDGYRSIYARNGKIFVNQGEVTAGTSFASLLAFQKLGQTYFLIDTRGDPVKSNDFNGWQIDANVLKNWPAHSGKAGTLGGTVCVAFMDGHAEARPKKDIPANWQNPFWQPPVN